MLTQRKWRGREIQSERCSRAYKARLQHDQRRRERVGLFDFLPIGGCKLRGVVGRGGGYKFVELDEGSGRASD